MKVGDLVKYNSRMGTVKVGLIVAHGGNLASTPIWTIQRIKSGYSGKIIREHTLQGDILEVVNASR